VHVSVDRDLEYVSSDRIGRGSLDHVLLGAREEQVRSVVRAVGLLAVSTAHPLLRAEFALLGECWGGVRLLFDFCTDPNATRVDEQSSRVRFAITPSIASSVALGLNQRDVDEAST
jgi:hypothetical protein